MHSKSIAALVLGLATLGLACTARTASQAESTDQQAQGLNAGYTEVARGLVSALKASPTYNNPTGPWLRVTVTGCTLGTLSVGVLDSNAQPVNLLAAGIQTTGINQYVSYWQLQPFAGDYDLGYITVVASAALFSGQCFAVAEQANGFIAPPAPPPPPVRPACFALDQFTCQITAGCQANFQNQVRTGLFGAVTIEQVYTGCTPAPQPPVVFDPPAILAGDAR
jgi:hypothetical protein